MSNTKEKGSAAVEMICVIICFLALVLIVKNVSHLSTEARELSINVQNRVEKKMIDAGRPPCLIEEFGERIVRARVDVDLFGGVNVEKGLIFAASPFCTRGSI